MKKSLFLALFLIMSLSGIASAQYSDYFDVYAYVGPYVNFYVMDRTLDFGSIPGGWSGPWSTGDYADYYLSSNTFCNIVFNLDYLYGQMWGQTMFPYYTYTTNWGHDGYWDTYMSGPSGDISVAWYDPWMGSLYGQIGQSPYYGPSFVYTFGNEFMDSYYTQNEITVYSY